MISSIAEFLEKLMEREAELLAQQPVVHAPTIGDMYEGLAHDILGRAIPPGLGLQLLEGFVEAHDGTLSNQMDAMLVMGNSGRKIPRTSHHIWPIQDVLAVFEIKKTLHGAELADGIGKMQKIGQFWQNMFLADKRSLPIAASRRAFARIMNRFPHDREMEDFENPGGEIYRTIALEQHAPVRIIFGYGGYAGEYGLREGFLKFLEDNPGGAFGPALLPNLIVCGTNSLTKLNGHPYSADIQEGWWKIIGSERTLPLRILIELIWTRLSNQFEREFPMDDTLLLEQFAVLLDGKPLSIDGQRGWYLNIHSLSKEALASIEPDHWTPTEVTQPEQVSITYALLHGGLDITSPGHIAYAEEKGIEPKALAQSLVDKSLFAWVGENVVHPIVDTIHTSFTPDGRIWAADNQKLLMLWIAAYPEKDG